MTPHEKALSKKQNLQNVRIFGSRTYVHDEKIHKGNKTQARANVHYLVGFIDTGYQTYDSKTCKTHFCCSVKIDEMIQYKHDYPSTKNVDLLTINTRSPQQFLSQSNKLSIMNSSDDTSNSEQPSLVRPSCCNTAHDTHNSKDNGSNVIPDACDLATASETEEIELDLDWDLENDISLRKCLLSAFYEPLHKLDSELTSLNTVPIIYQQAVTGPDRLIC